MDVETTSCVSLRKRYRKCSANLQSQIGLQKTPNDLVALEKYPLLMARKDKKKITGEVNISPFLLLSVAVRFSTKKL